MSSPNSSNKKRCCDWFCKIFRKKSVNSNIDSIVGVNQNQIITDTNNIDRENNNSGYSPDNCRWVKKEIQARNTRQIMITNKSGYRGVSWHKRYNKWVAKINVNKKRIHLGYFEDKIEASKAYDKYVIDNNLEYTRNFT